jgi:hypothetical protein
MREPLLPNPSLVTMLSQIQRRSLGQRLLDRISERGEVAQRPRQRIRQNIRGARDPILSNDTREQIWQFPSPGALPRFDVPTPAAFGRSVKVPARHIIVQGASKKLFRAGNNQFFGMASERQFNDLSIKKGQSSMDSQ